MSMEPNEIVQLMIGSEEFRKDVTELAGRILWDWKMERGPTNDDGTPKKNTTPTFYRENLLGQKVSHDVAVDRIYHADTALAMQGYLLIGNNREFNQFDGSCPLCLNKGYINVDIVTVDTKDCLLHP